MASGTSWLVSSWVRHARVMLGAANPLRPFVYLDNKLMCPGGHNMFVRIDTRKHGSNQAHFHLQCHYCSSAVNTYYGRTRGWHSASYAHDNSFCLFRWLSSMQQIDR